MCVQLSYFSTSNLHPGPTVFWQRLLTEAWVCMDKAQCKILSVFCCDLKFKLVLVLSSSVDPQYWCQCCYIVKHRQSDFIKTVARLEYSTCWPSHVHSYMLGSPGLPAFSSSLCVVLESPLAPSSDSVGFGALGLLVMCVWRVQGSTRWLRGII